MSKKTFDKERYAELLMQALPRVIETKKEHEEAFAVAVSLIDKGAKRSVEETKLLSLVTVLIETYETNKVMVGGKSSALDTLKHLMEANGHSAKDLWVLADKAVISKILAGERAISKNVAKALGAFYNVPISVFI
jgi:HTH-type transcriptional regulator / antitoxin HigA